MTDVQTFELVPLGTFVLSMVGGRDGISPQLSIRVQFLPLAWTSNHKTAPSRDNSVVDILYVGGIRNVLT